MYINNYTNKTEFNSIGHQLPYFKRKPEQQKGQMKQSLNQVWDQIGDPRTV